MSILDEAVRYLDLGWPVIPAHTVRDGECSCGNEHCESAGKHPRIAWAIYQTRVASADELRRWWTRWPDANVAVVTGAVSGIVVLDVDPRHGGDESIRDLTLPPTATAITGGGGQHYIYAHPGGAVANGAHLLPGIDMRGDGGYVIAPPSLHASGRAYTWETGYAPWETAPAALPEGVLERLRGWSPPFGAATERFSWEEADRRIVHEGERNVQMTRIIGHLLGQGLDAYDVLQTCRGINQRLFRPPLLASEVEAVLGSIRSREARKREVKQAAGSLLATGRVPDEMPAGQRLQVASEIWRSLGVLAVQSWRLLLGQESEYLLATACGEAALGGNLLDGAAVRRVIHTRLGVLIPRLKAPDWEQQAHILRQTALVEEVEPVRAERVGEWIAEYVDHYGPREWAVETRKDAFSGGPILAAGYLWIRPPHFRSFIEHRMGEKRSVAEVYKFLRSAGWESAVMWAGTTTLRGWRKEP